MKNCFNPRPAKLERQNKYKRFSKKAQEKKGKIKMTGYVGYSMSNNAVDAYNAGEMPFSKWTKTAILKDVAEIYGEKLAQAVSGWSLPKLKEVFLYKSSCL